MTNKPNWVRGICIGKGSFGTVNLAIDKSNGDVFAVKSVKQNSGHLSQALENEIAILNSLSSDYIVGFRGDDITLESCSEVYRNLHMEYMPGGTVADLGTHCKDDVAVRGYTRCIVSALSYIHARNIVHCDVKGKNVLIGVGSGVAKLADFGSALELGGQVLGPHGSPLWMAPEVIRGDYQGSESDVWSLGCTVIEMITGHPAWQDTGFESLCQIGYSDDLPKLPAQISDDLRDFLSKCLRRNHSERWSCNQLLQHQFLLSYSSSPSKFMHNKYLSPRCVFDWSESNFFDDNASEIEHSHVNSNSYVRQKIAELSSSSAANWESDGWELVRSETVLTAISPLESEFLEHKFIDLEMTITWPKYSELVEINAERTNEEYRDSNGSFHNYHQCTSNHAHSRSVGWSNRDE